MLRGACREDATRTWLVVGCALLALRACALGDHTLRVTSLMSAFALRQSDGCVPSPSVFPGKVISTLPCTEVKIEVPYSLLFDRKQSGVPDKFKHPTGLTMYMPSSRKGVYYNGSRFLVQKPKNRLRVFGIQGTWEGATNTVRNAVGVPLPLPGISVRMTVTVEMPNLTEDKKERFCLFTAVSDDFFVWMCVRRLAVDYKVYFWYEYEGEGQGTIARVVSLGSKRTITLQMDLYPRDAEVDMIYQVPGAAKKRLRRISVSPLLFNVDQAGSDSTIGSRTNGGFVGLADWRQNSPRFFVNEFEVSQIVEEVDTGTGESGVDFNVWNVEGIEDPTSMVFAGERLWVANVQGMVYSIEFDALRTKVVSSRVFTPVGTRLLLGIAADPDFDSNRCLWLSHSWASQDAGEANSGTITRACGVDLDDVTDVVIGLPRALANHATNNLFFKDGLLYIAIGGNTASGAPNLHENFAFLTRPEQPLSAAIVRFNVFKKNFKGDCTPAQDPATMDATGIAEKVPPNCDAEVYATGNRNTFDCVWHSNGKLYCPDNAIGGLGTFPVLPLGYAEGDPCDGIVSGDDMTTNDPGIRHDALYEVTQGKYYGHPNPSRYECVMEGGNPTSGADWKAPVMPVADGGTTSFQVKQYPVGVQPHSYYEPPIASFGKNRSPNGIIEYTSDRMCGRLQNQLLVAFFSVNAQVRRIQLSGDGTRVVNDGTLKRTTEAAGGAALKRPLGIAQDESGNLFVGQFGGDRVTVLNPKSVSCSRRTASATAPVELEDAASATDRGRRLYVFGGRRRGRARREAYVYDAELDTWSALARLPEALAGASAVVSAPGRVMVIGGERADGSLSARVWELDLATGSYEAHSELPEGRAGSVVAVHGGLVTLASGVTERTSASTDVLRLKDGAWKPSVPMAQPRAHAAGAVTAQGLLMVCGGRTGLRSTATCEQFDGTRWLSATPMPSARSDHAIFAVESQLVVKGGHGDDLTINDDIDRLDLASSVWSRSGKMRTGRTSAISASFGDQMYIFSGRSDADATRRGEVVYMS